MAGMRQEAAIDGFRLAYERTGSGPAVLLLHGWPGDRTDYRAVVPLVSQAADVIVPDLRGFGESDKHIADPAREYNAAAQARSIAGLIGELGLGQVVLAGYDIGSRIAQAVARNRPDLVRALVIAPPLPGIGDRILAPQAQREFWYQAFHNLGLSAELIDGQPVAVRAYLRHFWSHWSGPAYEPDDGHLDHLVSVYGPPGAFTASIAWYRAGAGSVAASLAEQVPSPGDRIAVPTTVLWPEHDPLFPREWSDRIGEFFADPRLTWLDGAGHFSPLEAPGAFAAAVVAAAGTGAAGPAPASTEPWWHTRPMRFRATVELGGKTATGIEVPQDVVAALGSGNRPPVTVTIGGHTYRTTVARMGGRFLVPLSAENRTEAGVAAGDQVDVDIDLDSGPREVVVPADLAAALAQDDTARANFDGQSYTHRKEWVRWIEEAKKSETRATRLTKTVESLRAGKRAR